jgi:hypothetical protein
MCVGYMLIEVLLSFSQRYYMAQLTPPTKEEKFLPDDHMSTGFWDVFANEYVGGNQRLKWFIVCNITAGPFPRSPQVQPHRTNEFDGRGNMHSICDALTRTNTHVCSSMIHYVGVSLPTYTCMFLNDTLRRCIPPHLHTYVP